MSGYFWHHKVVQSPCRWFSAAWSWHRCLERLRSIRRPSAGMHPTLMCNHIQHFDIALWQVVCNWQRLEKKTKKSWYNRTKTKVKSFGIDIRNRHCLSLHCLFWSTVANIEGRYHWLSSQELCSWASRIIVWVNAAGKQHECKLKLSLEWWIYSLLLCTGTY